MVMKIITKMAVARKRGTKGIVYRSPRIYLPTKLTDDSSFPFLEGDDVAVKIAGERLIVELSWRRGKFGTKRGASSSGKLVGGRRRKKRLMKQGLKRVGTRRRR